MVSFTRHKHVYSRPLSKKLMIVYHDEILNDLRREPSKRLVTSYSKEEEKDKKAGNGRYAIPRGGLFNLVSFPNYLCEWLVTIPLCSLADI